jgi:hypothetical protein
MALIATVTDNQTPSMNGVWEAVETIAGFDAGRVLIRGTKDNETKEFICNRSDISVAEAEPVVEAEPEDTPE